MTETGAAHVSLATRGYRVEIRPEEDGSWTALVPDLPGCAAVGDSPNEALAELPDVIDLWIETAIESGVQVVAPRPAVQASGRVLMRLPRDLHGALIRRAESEGVSLNTFCVSVLTAGVANSLAAAARQQASNAEYWHMMIEPLLSEAFRTSRLVPSNLGGRNDLQAKLVETAGSANVVSLMRWLDPNEEQSIHERATVLSG